MRHRARQNGFTLVELVVAVGLLVMVLSFAGVIFRVSIDSYRIASANAEIMTKLRAITDQLDADFAGYLDTDFGAVVFDWNADGNKRSDKIGFFATGDFQSTRQYPGKYGPKTVAGNTAFVLYCLVKSAKPASNRKILVRRQVILTADDELVSVPLGADPNSGGYCEYYKSSLSELTARLAVLPPADACDVYFDLYLEPPLEFDPNKPGHVPMYLTDGVDSFKVECMPAEPVGPARTFNQWWGSNADIEAYKNVTGIDWLALRGKTALKFTFTLYDSRGILKGGRTFTYIVHLAR